VRWPWSYPDIEPEAPASLFTPEQQRRIAAVREAREVLREAYGGKAPSQDDVVILASFILDNDKEAR
jgi:hypothetical protein